MDEVQERGEQAASQPAAPADDAADVARVAQLVARAGLRLTTAEITQLVAEYRYDRRGFDLMRTMLEVGDEAAHSFQAAHAMRARDYSRDNNEGGEAHQGSAGRVTGDVDAENGR